MLLRKLRSHPDNRDGLKAGRVCQQLAQMGVVGSLELILDQYPMTTISIFAEDIRSKWAYATFLRFEFELKSYGLG